MQAKLTLRRLSATLTLLLASAAVSAASYSSLIVFGDSLSDGGNNALAIGADPGQVIASNSYIPSQPYASLTYSDGPVWVDSFASMLGLSATPSMAGGTNFAYGGARTMRNTLPFPPGLRDQVDSYLGLTGGVAAADALYVIAGGGNNARDALEAIAGGAPMVQTLALAGLQYASNIGRMVDELQAAGAQHIVVWNTPNLAYAPAVSAEGALAQGLGQAVASFMNQVLDQRLQAEVGVRTFDLFGLLGQAVASPAAYGFTDVSNACGAVVGCDPSTYLFWDGIHPTSGGHQLLANAMFAAVVPETGTVWMFGAGLALLLGSMRRRRRG